jgi:hypothetical protein
VKWGLKVLAGGGVHGGGRPRVDVTDDREGPGAGGEMHRLEKVRALENGIHLEKRDDELLKINK